MEFTLALEFTFSSQQILLLGEFFRQNRPSLSLRQRTSNSPTHRLYSLHVSSILKTDRCCSNCLLRNGGSTMSQNKIGEFIQQSRKAKGFTQKDLGDRIGVSDKTISKWENGNSIPDTSILNELCATLDINVNELLSGEKLTPEIYSMKAEENMMNLLEDNQKQQRSTILPFAAGVILLLLTGLLAIFTHVFSPDMLELWDVPTLLIYIGICCSLVLLSGKRHKQEIIDLLRKIVIPVGCICPLLGINQFIHQFRDPADIGFFVNQCVLFVLYSLIAYVILVLIEQHLDK